LERFESVSYRMCAVGGKKLESSISKFSKSLLLMLFAFWPQVSFADVPIWLGQASKICTGQQYRDAQGVLQTGTKNCAASACGEDGQVSCVTIQILKVRWLLELAQKLSAAIPLQA